MRSVNEFKEYKQSGIPISMVTCYDYWSAQIIQDTKIDAVLVGDSVSMVMHGYKDTLNATVQMMIYHIAAVRKGLKEKFLIADLPFLAGRRGRKFVIDVVEKFIKNGANAIKIEGAGYDNLKLIKFIVESGIPVMGHLGLTPQSVNLLGGFKVQGNEKIAAQKIIKDAKELESAGCFSLVLEMIPANLAKQITNQLTIPTIGIGAGKYTSGQILVLHDLIGVTKDFKPRFVRKYLDGFNLIKDALEKFDSDIKKGKFPTSKESF